MQTFKEEKLDHKIIISINAMTRFNFSRKIPLSRTNNIFYDYTASCLNTIAGKFDQIAMPISLAKALQDAPKEAGTILTNIEGKIRYVNEKSEKLIGISKKTLLKKNIEDILFDYETIYDQILESNLLDYYANFIKFNDKNKIERVPIFLDVSVGRNRLGIIEGVLFILKN